MDFTSIANKRYETAEFLSQNVTPLMTPIIEKVLIERPNDVASFMAKQFATASGRTVSSPTKKKSMEASDENGVEMDTAESANMSDEELWSLLLPNGTMPGLSHPTISKFSISYNSSLLSGWVKQRSPGCAAASVAGAFNALKDINCNDPRALSMDDVILVLCDIQRARADKKRSRIERFLLGASIEPLDVALREYIIKHHDGKTFAGENKATCCGKKIRNSALKKLVYMRRKTAVTSKECITETTETAEENKIGDSNDQGTNVSAVKTDYVLESKYGGVVPKKEEKASPAEEYEIATKVSNVAKEDWIHQAPVFEQIRELIEIKEKEEEMMKEQSLSFNLLEGNDESGGEDEEGGGEDEDCIKSSSKKKEFSWYKEIREYFEIITGLEKLQRKKPSTAAFGNWGIMAAVRECNEADDTGNFTASYFMGRGARGSKVVNRLTPNSVNDQKYEMELERSFQLLKLEHSHPNAVLLSHHKNHYALIYAVRDWVEKIPLVITTNDDNNDISDAQSSQPIQYHKKRVRQVLTARRGQRPSAWINWEELRGVYLKWAGYKLMSIRYTPYDTELSGFSVHK
jgi:hypothetical protein